MSREGGMIKVVIGSARPAGPQKPERGAEDIRPAKAAGLGDHGKIMTFTAHQAPPGNTRLDLAGEDDAVRAQRPAGGDGDISATEHQSAQAGCAGKVAGDSPQKLA